MLGREWKIDHRTAVSTIYSASITLWLFGVVAYVLSIFVKSPKPWVGWIAIVIAIIATYLGSRLMKGQKKRRQREMRDLAREAVRKAARVSVSQAASDPEFIKRYAPQSGRPPVLYFRALLTEGSDPRVQLHRA